MEEQNKCAYKDIICNSGDCSICGTYFKHKIELEEKHKKDKKVKINGTQQRIYARQ